VGEYPKKIKKNPTPTQHVVAGVVWRRKKVLITQRKADGLLGGLWEFPGGTVRGQEAPPNACLRQIRQEAGLVVEMEDHITRVKHAYTHFKIIMDVYCCRYITGKIKLAQPADYRWITLDQIPDFPFHKAIHKFIPDLKKCPPATGQRA
ncbi:MAG: NUDIX domain-containing protein, partial [Deltaproteobacteria bacterium]|nr:NUDIX domain-containing protein [Deltaproteobacteria bacterium]